MVDRTNQLVTRLKGLQSGGADIEASAVVSVDGFIMASSLPDGIEKIEYRLCRRL